MRYAEPRITQKAVGELAGKTTAWANAELLTKPIKTLRNLWLNETDVYWALAKLFGYNDIEWIKLLDLPQSFASQDGMPIYKLSTPWPHNPKEQISKVELGKALARLGRLEHISKSLHMDDAAKIIIDSDLRHRHAEIPIAKNSVVIMDYSQTSDFDYGDLAFIDKHVNGLRIGRFLGIDGAMQFELLSGEGVLSIDRRRVVGRCYFVGG